MTKLKVALMHFYFEDYTIELANALAKIVDLTVIQPEKVAKYCSDKFDPNVRVISFAKPRIRQPGNFFSMVAMMKIIRDLDPDVLHVQETNDPWYDITLLFNKMPPLVTTIHDVFHHPGDKNNTFGTEYTKRISFYRSAQTIVHAQCLQQILIERFGLDAHRVNVLAHGELGELYQRCATAPLPPREPHTLLFFGRVWPYKGLQYLLAAMPLIAERIPDVKLIIAGKGEDLDRYLADGVDRRHLEIIDEFIPTERVADLFARSTIAALPYIESSQSGVAALAYGMGAIVVASAIGGLQEFVRSGSDGWLVPPGDPAPLAEAIVRILQDPELQQQLRAAATERCRQDLNWHHIAQNTVTVYHQAIATQSS